MWKDEGTSIYGLLGDAFMKGWQVLPSLLASIPPWVYVAIALLLLLLLIAVTYLWPILETITDQSQAQTD